MGRRCVCGRVLQSALNSTQDCPTAKNVRVLDERVADLVSVSKAGSFRESAFS